MQESEVRDKQLRRKDRSSEQTRTYKDELRPMRLDWTNIGFSRPLNLQLWWWRLPAKRSKHPLSTAKCTLGPRAGKADGGEPLGAVGATAWLMTHVYKGAAYQQLRTRMALCRALAQQKRIWTPQVHIAFQIALKMSFSGTPHPELLTQKRDFWETHIWLTWAQCKFTTINFTTLMPMK